MRKVAELTPVGFKDRKACNVSVVFDGITYCVKPDEKDADELRALIIVSGEERGYIKAAYPKNIFPEGGIVFLEQEEKLLNTIAARISETICAAIRF